MQSERRGFAFSCMMTEEGENKKEHVAGGSVGMLAGEAER